MNNKYHKLHVQKVYFVALETLHQGKEPGLIPCVKHK